MDKASNPTRLAYRPNSAGPARLLRAALDAYGLDRKSLRRLASLSPSELRTALAQHADAPELHALLEIQAVLLTPTRREPIRSAADIAALLMTQLGHLDQEHLFTICLDARHCVQEIVLVYQGSTQRAQVRIGEIFKPAIERNSSAVILAHNHPSGVSTPSEEDLALTQRCARASTLLDIALIDHVIIGAGEWSSMRALVAGQAALSPRRARRRLQSADQ